MGKIKLRWDRIVLGMLEGLLKIGWDKALAQKPVIVGASHVLRDDRRNCIPRSLPWQESFGKEGDLLRHSKLFEGFKVQLGEDPIQARRGGLRAGGEAYGGEPSVDLLRSFLNLGHAGDWLTLSSRGGADVPKALIKPITHLEDGKGLNTSWKYSPKKPVIYHHGQAPVINAEPISVVHPSDVVENIVDSHNISADKGELSLIDPDAPSYLEEGKSSMVAGKRKVVLVPMERVSIERLKKFMLKQYLKFPFAKELKDATDCHWVVGYVTRPSWKQTRELIFALYKARASCDTMQEREIKKDKIYAELEKKCNEALQDLDKNPLVSDMHAEIKTLQSQVNGLHSEYSKLILEKKKWINYEQTLSTLRAKDRAIVVSKVIPDAAIKLIHSDEMGVLIARLVKASIIYGRCSAFEEVAELKKPFILEEMPGYLPSSKEEYDRAGNDLADASYPFLAELTADPQASMEHLLSKKL
ncbi:hypothetical protein Tco_0763995 [Tanacetum coccineum]